MLEKEEPIAAPTASLKELAKNIDADYLGLAAAEAGTEAASDLAALEEMEALAEASLRSEMAAIELQEKFLAKKRRRIELLKSQTKEVTLSTLSVDQFSALLFTGAKSDASSSTQTTALISASLLRQPNNGAAITAGVPGTCAQGDPTTAELLRFSHEVKPTAFTNSTATADKIKQRNLLLEAYASKQLQASQQQSQVQP